MYFFPLLFGINFEPFSSLRGRSPQPPPPTVSQYPLAGLLHPLPWGLSDRADVHTQVIDYIIFDSLELERKYKYSQDTTAVFSPGVGENAPTSHPFGGYEVRNSQNDCVNLPFLRFFCYTLFFIEGADFPSWWVSPSHLKDIWITNRGSKRAKNK